MSPSLPAAVVPARTLSTGVAGGAAIQFAGLGLGFGVSVLLAHWLTASGYGIYAFAFAVANFAAVPAAMGLPMSLLKHAVTYRDRHEWGRLKGMLGGAQRAIFAAGVALAAAMAAVAWIVLGQSKPLLAAALSVGAVLVPLISLCQLRRRELQALHRPVLAQLPEQALRPAAMLLVAGAVWMAGYRGPEAAAAAIGALALSFGFALVVGTILLRRATPSNVLSATPVRSWPLWLQTGWPMALSDSFSNVYLYADLIVLGALAPSAAVGVYQAAARTACLLLVFLTAANMVVAPHFSRLHGAGAMDELQALVTRAIRPIFALSLIAFVLAAVFGKYFLSRSFGAEFARGYAVLLIVGGAKIVDVACGPVAMLLNMTGHQRSVMTSIAGFGVFNIAACLALVPRFGIIGAATASAAAMILNNVVLAVRVKRAIGVSSTVLGTAV